MLLVLRYLQRLKPSDTFLFNEAEKLQKDLSLAVQEEYCEMGLCEPDENEDREELAAQGGVH
jgi:DNA polymerase III delta subunit